MLLYMCGLVTILQLDLLPSTEQGLILMSFDIFPCPLQNYIDGDLRTWISAFDAFRNK